MTLYPLSSLRILPDRQRPADSPSMAPEKIAELAESIEARGLLQPLVVEKGGILRAGERRSKALAFLYAQGIAIRHGSTEIPLGQVPVVEFDELPPIEAFLVELEENEKREALSWQEKAAAHARLHALLSPTSTTPKEAVRATLATFERTTPEAVDTSGGGKLVNAHQTILIGQNLHDPDIAKAKTQREALKILDRKLRKAEDSKVEAILPHAFLGDCLSILPEFPSSYFECVISDPPYGIGITQLSYQSSSEQEFDDSYEYWQYLMPVVLSEYARVLKPDAHGYLFCAFERFTELSAFAVDAGFEVYPRPLIWDRSPDGRLTTPEKWPRRCFECILYFRRGRRDLLEIRGDVLRYPADRDSGNYHGAKKPVDLAVDLLQRSTRPGDRVLDSFGGSGFLVRAGKQLSREVWVIEKDPSYFGLMQQLASA